MNKRELKNIIFQVLMEDGIGSSAGSTPANVSPNISGYDGPLGTIIKRKINRKSDRKRKVQKI